MRVAIFGASGLLGSTVVQRLRRNDRIEVRPLIHSTGRAWSLARLGIPLETADVLKPDEIRDRLAGCTHVVNCSRGPNEVMFQGFQNLLDACRRCGIERLVHISSVSSYGDLQPADDVTEDQRPGPLHSGYAKVKARQDTMVEQAVRRGLDVISLCPPMITGPCSGFILDLIKLLRGNSLALLEEGRFPCPTADVANVALAVEQSLLCSHRVKGRVFITDGATLSWREIIDSLLPLSGREPPLQSLSQAEAQRVIEASEKRKATLRGAIRHLTSSKFRAALSEDPAFARLETALKSWLKLLPKGVVQRLKKGAADQAPKQPSAPRPKLDGTVLWRQNRRLTFSIEKARAELGYQPIVDAREGLRAFHRWYGVESGVGGENWDLLRLLRPTRGAAEPS